MHILFADDNSFLGLGTRLELNKMQHHTEQVHGWQQAEHKLQLRRYDLVIFDMGGNASAIYSLLERLRLRQPDLPVLLLAQQASVGELVRGLDAGADDYLVKPFTGAEFAARVRALLRRRRLTQSTRHNRLQVDETAQAATIGAVSLNLSPRDFELLALFARNPGKLLEKAELMRCFGEWDKALGGNAVEVSVCRLRKKLEPHGVRIRSVRHVGYWLDMGMAGEGMADAG